MKSSADASPPRNSNTSHPPLARNAQGHPIAMPDGAAWWSIKRETRGRPKVITGPDGHPYRLALTATEQDVADAFGPDTYRLDALDALGNVLDYVTTIVVTRGALDEDDDEDDDDDDASDTGSARGASSDLRFALQTIMQMSRAQSESLRAVSEAQADWVKGLANAKALPRNAGRFLPPPPTRDLDDDDDHDDDDDEEESDDQPAASAAAPSWSETMAMAMAPSITKLVEALLIKYAAAPAPQAAPATQPDPAAPASTPAPPPNASSPPNAMVHLAAIMRGLTEDERATLDAALRSRDADMLTTELLARSVGDAVAFFKELVELRTRQAHARREARARATPPAPTGEPPEAPPTTGAGATLRAVAALLDADQRAAVLALLAHLPSERLEALKAMLLAMSTEDAASWLQQHLSALRAEAGL